MAFIVRQNKALFDSSGLNLSFTPESFETFCKGGNAEHLKSFFSQQGWHTRSPLEIHPYLDKYPTSFACQNLLIGTMPPITYLRHSWHHTPIDETGIGSLPNHYYYYGNRGQCWDYFVHRDSDLADVEGFLRVNNMAVSDTVKVCQRERNTKYQVENIQGRQGRRPNAYSPSDVDLRNILLNENLITELLSPASRIQNLYFTSGRLKKVAIDSKGLPDLSNTNFGAFSSFIATILLMKVSVEFSAYTIDQSTWYVFNRESQNLIRENLGEKIIFKIRLDRKHEFTAICLPSPATALGVTKHFLFHQWLKYYSEAGYRDFEAKISLDQIVRKYPEVPVILEFEKPWESFKRDIYLKSLTDWKSLVAIQSQVL